MIQRFMLRIGLGCGFLLGFWLAFNFKAKQETYFTKLMKERNVFQNQIKKLEDDLIFLKAHEKELDFLAAKGWFLPKSRLIVGEVLEKLGHSLDDIQYSFEPEAVKSADEKHTFKVTKIVMKVAAQLDTDIYAFIESLSENFPGILRAHTINLEKDEDSHFVKGKLVFEWVAIGT
ncbi:MAG TPA: hypothetical protein VMW10_06610 [Alphaproteobacteria bacterium]|nr:hypothetical protein [Alphaproteobacteria bacterium]